MKVCGVRQTGPPWVIEDRRQAWVAAPLSEQSPNSCLGQPSWATAPATRPISSPSPASATGWRRAMRRRRDSAESRGRSHRDHRHGRAPPAVPQHPYTHAPYHQAPLHATVRTKIDSALGASRTGGARPGLQDSGVGTNLHYRGACRNHHPRQFALIKPGRDS